MANDGIKINDFNYDNKYTQIGGEDAKTDKINYSDGLTKSEAQRINEKYGKNDGTITEDQFIEACLNDDEETSGIKTKDKSEIKNVFQKYLTSYTNDSNKTSSSSSKKDEVKPSVELQSGSNLPSSLKFGPSISISNIKSGDKEGEFYNSMEMDGKTYKKSKVDKNHSGAETYVLIPEPEDGSKIVIEKHANGTQHFAVYGTDKKAKSQLELDKEGKAKSIFRFDEKTGLAYEREYLDGSNILRKYERDENNKLISSTDYIKKDDGTIDENRPYSKQTYTDVEDVGKKWASRVIFEYDDDGKQSVKETHKYNWEQEKNEDGELTGKLTKTEEVYQGDSTDEKDLISKLVTELTEGVISLTIETDKNKKITEVKYNSDGSTTTTITEGDKKTVIEKDKDGKVITETITENGITKTKNGNGTTDNEAANFALDLVDGGNTSIDAQAMKEKMEAAGCQFDDGAWCGDFCGFVLASVYGKDNTPGDFYNDCWYPGVGCINDWAQEKGVYATDTSEVQPGDLIVYGRNHVGMVVKVNGDGTVDTVEGNTSNEQTGAYDSPTGEGWCSYHAGREGQYVLLSKLKK